MNASKLASSSGRNFFHRPSSPRNVGTPLSAETPAPVRTQTSSACRIRSISSPENSIVLVPPVGAKGVLLRIGLARNLLDSRPPPDALFRVRRVAVLRLERDRRRQLARMRAVMVKRLEPVLAE